jgi:U3 small nucleolar RNA-associated protein 14
MSFLSEVMNFGSPSPGADLRNGASGRTAKKFAPILQNFDKDSRPSTRATTSSRNLEIMPGRQSHGVPPSKKPKAKVNSKKRSLNAFSIAAHENPDKIKIKQHRLGVKEGGNRPGKRQRDEEGDENEEEETTSKKQRKGPAKGRFDELDVDEGSDSEGNEWKLGQVDSDDDSDLDSDEAFGESDEERFDGFAFSGSSDKKSKKRKQNGRSKVVNLDEDDDEDSDSELEEGDLGEDAVNLADMLDVSSDEDEVPKKKQAPGRHAADSDSDNGDSEESDDKSSASSADEDDDETNDPAKIAALQSLIANLPQTDESSKGPAKQRSDGASEYNTPSDFGLTSKTKLTLEDLGLPSISDPHVKKSLKFLDSEATGKKVPARLEVPLAKRQQDRLDRSAAYEKSKDTLDRWTDTVKHNRRADHLIFPLQDADTATAQSNKQLAPTNLSKPFNELEATIQSILEESGLATANGKDDEDKIREFEELETKKLSMEEVKARRDQLRMARELLFREEAKAKRIKKIKSKSYRKVHRKQREKEERLNREALAEGGFVLSEDELEAQDRRRAEARMGAKHRGSKWAKAIKETGRTAWDEDARSGITEMARRDEELRKRVEGRAVRKEFENDSDASMSDSDDLTEDDDEAEQRRLLRQLKNVNDDDVVDESAPGARLANMDFMRRADAARKKANDAMVEDMRRELAGEESASDEDGDEDVGRRIFGPGNTATQEKKSKKKISNEFEEPAGSDDEEENELEVRGVDNSPNGAVTSSPGKANKRASKAAGIQLPKSQPAESSEGGAWSKVTSKSASISDAEAKRRRHKKNNAIDVEELDLSKAAVIATQPKPKKTAKKSTALDVDLDSDESYDENTIRLPFALRDQELIKRAFAGADVVGEFEAEKKQTIEDEDEKVIDNTLPGWGSWVGNGVSKKDKARNKGRFLTKSEGIKAQNRKDAKLDRVIINEKRVKKVCLSFVLFKGPTRS